MKKNKVHIVISSIAVALVAFSFGCKNNNYAAELKEIETLRVTLASVDSSMTGLNPEQAEQTTEHVNSMSNFITIGISKVGDTLDFKTGELLNGYHGLLPALEAIAKNSKQMEAAIDSTGKGLSNLEHDLKNNTLAEGLTAAQCVERERENVNELKEQATELMAAYRKTKVQYDSLDPKIQFYVQQLNLKLQPK